MKTKDKEYEEKMKKLFADYGFEVITIDPGMHVNCDMCNEEYMDSEEKGGFLFESKAVCPKCAPRIEASAKSFNETHFIRKRAHKDETFRDFVYRIRKDYDK